METNFGRRCVVWSHTREPRHFLREEFIDAKREMVLVYGEMTKMVLDVGLSESDLRKELRHMMEKLSRGMQRWVT